MEKIELIDETGSNVTFYLLDTFGMNDDDYACLIREDDSEELYILKVQVDEGEVFFETIDDDEEFKAAVEVYEELKEEQSN